MNRTSLALCTLLGTLGSALVAAGLDQHGNLPSVASQMPCSQRVSLTKEQPITVIAWQAIDLKRQLPWTLDVEAWPGIDTAAKIEIVIPLPKKPTAPPQPEAVKKPVAAKAQPAAKPEVAKAAPAATKTPAAAVVKAAEVKPAVTRQVAARPTAKINVNWPKTLKTATLAAKYSVGRVENFFGGRYVAEVVVAKPARAQAQIDWNELAGILARVRNDAASEIYSFIVQNDGLQPQPAKPVAVQRDWSSIQPIPAVVAGMPWSVEVHAPFETARLFAPTYGKPGPRVAFIKTPKAAAAEHTAERGRKLSSGLRWGLNGLMAEASRIERLVATELAAAITESVQVSRWFDAVLVEVAHNLPLIQSIELFQPAPPQAAQRRGDAVK